MLYYLTTKCRVILPPDEIKNGFSQGKGFYMFMRQGTQSFVATLFWLDAKVIFGPSLLVCPSIEGLNRRGGYVAMPPNCPT